MDPRFVMIEEMLQNQTSIDESEIVRLYQTFRDSPSGTLTDEDIVCLFVTLFDWM